MATTKISTIGDLRDLIRDFPDELPVGVYHKGHWNPELEKGADVEMVEENGKTVGLALEIDYHANY